MKKILSIIMIMVLMLNVSLINVFAAENQKNINVFVDGSYIGYTDVRPFIEDGRTLVPVRAVAEKMGAEVLWNNDTQTVTMSKLNDKITYEDKEYFNCKTNVKLVIGQKSITIGLTDENGVQVFSVVKEMDVAAKIVSSRTFIPARFVGYALGYDVFWEDKPGTASKVLYKFIGKQIIDFDIGSEKPVIDDPVKRIDYEYDKEKYPDKIVVNNVEYPCRKGYDDIIIVDASHGRFEGTKMIDVFPYRWTANNIIIECDDEQYKIDENKSFEENFEAYSKFYTDKVGEKVVFDYGLYFPEFSSLDKIAGFGKRNDENELLDDGFDGYDYIDASKTYYSIVNGKPVSDITKMYYIDERPWEEIGAKIYGLKSNEILNKGHDKNTLLFLNSFLGETGQRIWTMMNDYYTLSGYSYVAPETKWTNMYLYNDDYLKTSYNLPSRGNGISSEIVEKYGFSVIDNRKVSGTQQLLTLKTQNQIIYVEYGLLDITTSDISAGYTVLFTTIEN